MHSALRPSPTDLSGSPRASSPRLPGDAVRRWRHRARVGWMARMRATQIDRELAAGSTSLPAQILAVRAQRITGSRSRRSLAAGLARVLKAAADSGANLTAAIGPDRHEVLAGRIVLGALERRLQAPEPVRAQGMAMLRLLLIEPDSPLYRPGEVGALGSRLRAAAAELEPGGGAR